MEIITEIKKRARSFCIDKYDGIYTIQEYATIESAMLIGASIVFEEQAKSEDRINQIEIDKL